MAVLIIGVLNVALFLPLSQTGSSYFDENSPWQEEMGGFPSDYFFATAKPGFDLGTLLQNKSGSGFLGSVPQNQNVFGPNNVIIYSPFAFTFADDASLLNQITVIKTYFASKQQSFAFENSWNGSVSTVQQWALPDQSFSLRNLNNFTLDYKIYNEIQPYLAFTWSQDQYNPTNLIGSLTNAFLSLYNWMPMITIYSGEFPYNQYFGGFSADVIFTPLLTFALSFWLPTFVYNFVSEKEEKLFVMMKTMGLDLRYYFLSNSIYHFVIIFIGSAIICALGMAFQFGAFLKTGFFIWFLPILGWALNMVSLSYFFQSFFSKGRTSNIVMNLLNILTIMLATALNFTVFNIISISGNQNAQASFVPTPAHPAFLLYPPFAFCRALFLIGANCSFQHCLNDNSILRTGEWPEILLVLYIGAPVIYLISWYLEQVLPQQYGVPKSPFFPFHAIGRLFKQKKPKFEVPENEPLLGKVEVEIVQPEINAPEIDQDHDVMIERKKVLDLEISEDSKVFSNYPIILKHFTKAYDDKVAVQDMNLAIEKNTCFGLLGPNGAGKTTLINCMTGFDLPTSGDAWVCGHNIKTDMDGVYSRIGVCPQFDILWPSLTAEETLLFYIRMKGIGGMNRHDECLQAMECLSHVGLQDASEVLVSALSGGMKRRLSVSVSLIGNPSVLFLDEPTTGLDVDVRRELWNTLLQLKKDKAIILTTHSMEEADTLCNKIAIMTRGALKCIGPNMYLKNRYGNGYLLKLQFSPENAHYVTEFVETNIPKAVLEEKIEGQISYRISGTELDMGSVLQSVLDNKEKAKIVDWGISSTSLDEVFLAVVRRDEESQEIQETVEKK